MSAPHTPRGVQQGQARALNRGAKGMGGGKYAGTSPARPRAARVTRNDTPPSDGGFSGWLGYVARGTGTLSSLANNTALGFGASIDSSPSTSWLTMASTNHLWRITEDGLYFVTVYVSASADPGAGARVTVQPTGGTLSALYLSRDLATVHLPAGTMPTGSPGHQGAVTFPLVVDIGNALHSSAAYAEFQLQYYGGALASANFETTVDIYKVA